MFLTFDAFGIMYFMQNADEKQIYNYFISPAWIEVVAAAAKSFHYHAQPLYRFFFYRSSLK